jgi:hypothetical protein
MYKSASLTSTFLEEALNFPAVLPPANFYGESHSFYADSSNKLNKPSENWDSFCQAIFV